MFVGSKGGTCLVLSWASTMVSLSSLNKKTTTELEESMRKI